MYIYKHACTIYTIMALYILSMHIIYMLEVDILMCAAYALEVELWTSSCNSSLSDSACLRALSAFCTSCRERERERKREREHVCVRMATYTVQIRSYVQRIYIWVPTNHTQDIMESCTTSIYCQYTDLLCLVEILFESADLLLHVPQFGSLLLLGPGGLICTQVHLLQLGLHTHTHTHTYCLELRIIYTLLLKCVRHIQQLLLCTCEDLDIQNLHTINSTKDKPCHCVDVFNILNLHPTITTVHAKKSSHYAAVVRSGHVRCSYGKSMA